MRCGNTKARKTRYGLIYKTITMKLLLAISIIFISFFTANISFSFDAEELKREYEESLRDLEGDYEWYEKDEELKKEYMEEKEALKQDYLKSLKSVPSYNKTINKVDYKKVDKLKIKYRLRYVRILKWRLSEINLSKRKSIIKKIDVLI